MEYLGTKTGSSHLVSKDQLPYKILGDSVPVFDKIAIQAQKKDGVASTKLALIYCDSDGVLRIQDERGDNPVAIVQ